MKVDNVGLEEFVKMVFWIVVLFVVLRRDLYIKYVSKNKFMNKCVGIMWIYWYY